MGESAAFDLSFQEPNSEKSVLVWHSRHTSHTFGCRAAGLLIRSIGVDFSPKSPQVRNLQKGVDFSKTLLLFTVNMCFSESKNPSFHLKDNFGYPSQQWLCHFWNNHLGRHLHTKALIISSVCVVPGLKISIRNMAEASTAPHVPLCWQICLPSWPPRIPNGEILNLFLDQPRYLSILLVVIDTGWQVS